MKYLANVFTFKSGQRSLGVHLGHVGTLGIVDEAIEPVGHSGAAPVDG